jgi:hypothetical protein
MAAPEKTVGFDISTTKEHTAKEHTSKEDTTNEDSSDDERITLISSEKQAAEGGPPLYQIFDYPYPESATVSNKKKGVEEDPKKIWLGCPSRRPGVYPWCGEDYIKTLENSGCTNVVAFPRDPAKTGMHRRRRSPNLALEITLLFSGMGH